MRKLLCLATMFALVSLPFAARAVTQKKSTARKGTKSAAVRKKSTPAAVPRKKVAGSAAPTHAASGKAAASKRGKKVPVRTARSRQLAPTPERYKEIQEALAAKGYFPAGEANGRWNDTSAEALKKFQADQNLDPTGKINAISLIALGLGPKRDNTVAAKPAASPSTP